MAARSDTIFALSSAPGKAGVAVVRVSGPAAGAAMDALTGKPRPRPREASLRRLVDKDGAAIDEGLVLWFPGPGSFTGEDSAEFQIHGGRAIVETLFAALARLGLRAAEPGEFTRRAVENGKFDLTRAEAIADLVAAETDAQRKQALRQYDGALATLYEGWRRELIHAAAWAEAAIDFADEELPEDLLTRAKQLALEINKQIQRHINDSHRGELVREGLHLTVIGPPNAGKSSLVNALAKRDVAIVSETAGTTRDVIEVRLDLGGYPVILADTAGLRTAFDKVEAEGVRRALARAEQADLVLLLLDGSEADPLANVSRETFSRAAVIAWNKVDLPWPEPREGLRLSLKTGAGLPELISALTEAVRQRLEVPRESAPLTRARHREALTDASAALARAAAAREPEFCAEDLRLALRAVGRITGRVDIEELLDVVFRDFCIGK
jgi:tRNA modification GTPase